MGKKWTMPLIEEIATGKFQGFNSTLGKTGMTPKTLSSQLKEMAAFGLIKKVGGKKTGYMLTEKGGEFRKIIGEFKKFNIKWGNFEAGCLEKSCLECGKFN
jgi:DNA-binding HxlR family transcriptional regulator